MDGYEWLPYQLGAMLLAFGVILAIARMSGSRRQDVPDASRGPDDAESPAMQGQARYNAAPASGERGSYVV